LQAVHPFGNNLAIRLEDGDAGVSGSDEVTMGTLFSDEFLASVEDLPATHPSFVAGLCRRSEPAIASFREQIGTWFGNLREDAQPSYRERLFSLDNPTFFQAFTELVLHEIMMNNSMRVVSYPVDDAEAMAAAMPDGSGAFGVAVQSFIPEVQVRGSMKPFRQLLRELKEIEHRFLFSVYLKRWLPFQFDPAPIRRALEVWLDSLEDTNWEGKYAEYRDDHIHLEFSILDRLRQPKKDLVKFRITPLRTPSVLDSLGRVIEAKVARVVAQMGEDTPLALALFGNEEWDLPGSYLEDFFYNKANNAFYWSTRGGRHERLKSFRSNGRADAIFARPSCRSLSAVVLVDKKWERDRPVFSLRVFHNPWCNLPLSMDVFEGFAQFRHYPQGELSDQAYMGWDSLERTRFILP